MGIVRGSTWILKPGVSGIVLTVMLGGCNGATFVVDTTADTVDAAPGDGVCDDGTGSCSLRAAIMESNALAGVDEVQLASGAVYTLTLAGTGEDLGATGDLDITAGVTIVGNGATIDAAGLDRVLDITAPSGQVVLGGLTVRGGWAPDGAGLSQRGGATTSLGSVHVTDSTATAGAPVSVTAGKLFMALSSITATSGTSAGALEVTGATADLVGLTVSGTTATSGATIVNGAGATTTLDESTVSANTSTTGALDDPGAGMAVRRSIVADQAAGPSCAAAISSGGYNLSSDTSCGLAGAGDQQGVSAGLGALDASGPVPVHVPGPGSAAIDGSTLTCRGTRDARLSDRPMGAACDIGAVEVLYFIVDNGGDTVDANPGDGTCADTNGDCTLRAAIDETNALGGEQAIVIDPAVSVIALTRAGFDDANQVGDLDITDPVTIDGNGATLRRDGGTDRILHATADLGLADLTLAFGYASSGPGGAILAEAGLLVVDGATFLDNETEFAGGAVALTGTASASIANSSFSGGIAFDGGGGAIWSDSVGDVQLGDVTLQDNISLQPGGAIGAAAGHLTLDGSLISSNHSNAGGGGISLSGMATATITDTTLTGNSTNNHGGGILLGTGVSGVELVNTTLHANTAGQGGGLYASDTATAVLRFSTLSDNTGYGLATDPGGQIQLATSIVTAAGASCPAAPANNVVSLGYNITSDSSCLAGGGTDLVDTDPLLAPFDGMLRIQDPSSPAVDLAPNPTPSLCDGGVATDARVLPRRVGSGCDAGAVELQRLNVDNGGDTVDLDPSDGDCADLNGDCTLRAAIDQANALAGEQAIIVDPAVVTIALTRAGFDDANQVGDLDITDPVTIDGNGATLRRDGGTDRILHATADVGLTDLTLAFGYASSGPGGAILAEAGLLVVDGATFLNNETEFAGGAVALTGTASASITNSSFSDGIAFDGGGGAIWSDSVGDVQLGNVTLQDNIGLQPGGAISAAAGHLTLDGSLISSNHSNAGGGGIFLSGTATATITDTILTGNSTQNNGGGLLLGADVTGVELVNTTVHGNSAGVQGGGLYASDGSTAILRFTTVSDNTGYTLATDPSGELQLVAGVITAAGANCPAAPANNVTSLGYNVASDSSCFLATGTDRTDADLLFAPFDPGTLVRIPHPTSPAVDLIPSGTPTLCDGSIPADGRGADRTSGDCDAGAVERNTTDRDCAGPYLPYSDMRGCDLSGLDFSGLDLSSSLLIGADVTGVDLTGTNLTDTDLTDVVGINTTTGRCTVTYTGTTLDGIDLSTCTLTGTTLAGATLTNAVLTNADLTGADLTDTDLTGVRGINTTTGRCTVTYTGATIGSLDLVRCDLTGADFSGSSLPRVDFYEAVLVDATFAGAAVGSGSFWYADLRRVDFTNAYLWNARLFGVDARDVILTGADVTAGQWMSANLTGQVGWDTTTGRCTVNISAATFPGVDYSGCEILYFIEQGFDYRGGDFSNTTAGWFNDGNMTDVNGTNMQVDQFSHIDATRMVLAGADLRGAPAHASIFVDADLTGAQIDLTSFLDANLTGADLTGASGTPASITNTTFSDTTCPTGINSDTNGATCAGEWLP